MVKFDSYSAAHVLYSIIIHMSNDEEVFKNHSHMKELKKLREK